LTSVTHHEIRWVLSDHSIFCGPPTRVPLQVGGHMGSERERVISITLSEAEWKAFVARQPQPVLWLRERIRDEAGTPPQDSKSAA
jgi:hypothetical protein